MTSTEKLLRTSRHPMAPYAVGALAALLVGCNAQDPPDRAAAAEAALTAGAPALKPAIAYEFSASGDSPNTIAERARVLASVVVGQELAPAGFDAAASRASEIASNPLEDRIYDVATTGSENLVVSLDEGFEALGVSNEEVISDVFSSEDIGATGARAQFDSTVQSLLQVGALDGTGLDLQNPQLSNVIQGEGWSGQPPTERVKEYVFFVPRLLDGIGIRRGTQEAGLRISVHRGGRLASIRVIGPRRWQSAGPVTRAFSKQASDDRVAREYPDSVINSDGLRFLLHDGIGASHGASLPYETYSVSRTTQVEGRTIQSRIQYVSYRIDDATQPAIVWPK